MILPWVKRTRTSRRPTEQSMRYHGRRIFIGRLCPGLFVRTCIWNVSRGAVHRSWQTRTALLACSTLSFCFRSSRRLPLTLFSLRTKRCSRSLHLTIGRTTSVGDCRNFWRTGLAFSSVMALRGLPLPGRLLTVPVSRILSTPRFVQLFSGNSSVNLFAVYPFKYKLFFIKILSSSLIIMFIVDKHGSDDCCDEFLVPQIDRKCKQIKEHWHGKFYLQSVWRKIQYVKHQKYQKMNNKLTGH